MTFGLFRFAARSAFVDSEGRLTPEATKALSQVPVNLTSRVALLHRNSVDQTIPNNTSTRVVWTTADRNDSGIANLSTGVITPGVNGLVRIYGQVMFNMPANGPYLVQIVKNGAELKRMPQNTNASGAAVQAAAFALLVPMAVTDTLAIHAYAAPGASVALLGSPNYTWVQLETV